MVPIRFVVPAVLAALSLVASPGFAAPPLPVEMAGARAPAGTPKATEPALRLDGSPTVRRVDLPAPSAAERTTFVADRKRTTANASGRRGGPNMIGFGRDLPAAQRSIALSSLAWTTFAGGERVARIEVASADAKGVRVAVRLPAVDPNLALRFGPPGSSTSLLGVPAATIVAATSRFGEYWSPVVEGSRIAVELVAPAGAKLVGAIELARVSHLVVGAGTSAAEEAKILSDIGDAGSCNNNVKCVIPFDNDVIAQAAATGKLVFTIPGGGTASCTGTMLNEQLGSFTPYIFSANHCFESAYEAFTLNVWWFFDAISCSNGAVGSYVVQAGGAALLGRSQDWDWALLRMNTPPPGGTYFSGWNGDTIPPGTTVEAYHHPSGDLKKWSLGTSSALTTVGFSLPAGGPGLFTPVVWSSGTTEGGSSGGALVVFGPVGYQVRGGLLGGSALCSNLNGTDYYSLFGNMLPLVRQYLTPNAQDTSLVVVVEFYNSNLDHFFITADPAEIAGLDSGVFSGWERTGFRFLAHLSPGTGRNAVCRFYRKPEFGDSHFYSASPAECAAVATQFADQWVYENPAIFYIQLPNVGTGACPAGTKAIYRYFNQVEVNHRFTTEVTLATELKTKPGWIPEGYGPGPLYPVMCAPLGS